MRTEFCFYSFKIKSKSQRHCKNLIFNRMLSHSFWEELYLCCLRHMSKDSMGICFLYKHSQKITKRVSHLGQGAGENETYVNCNNFSNIALRHLGSCFPEACASSECVSLLTDARKATFSMEINNSERYGLRDCKIQLSESRMKMTAFTSRVKRLSAVNPGSSLGIN